MRAGRSLGASAERGIMLIRGNPLLPFLAPAVAPPGPVPESGAQRSNKLTTVEGMLQISQNDALISLEDLNSLTHVGGDLEIVDYIGPQKGAVYLAPLYRRLGGRGHRHFDGWSRSLHGQHLY